MARFIDHETRRRHRQAENSIESARGILTDERVIGELGTHAYELEEYLDDLYIPNQVDGVYTMSDAHGERGIPFVITDDSDVYFETPMITTLHEEQILSFTEAVVQDFPDVDITDAHIDYLLGKFTSYFTDEYPEAVDFNLPNQALAAVRAVVADINVPLSGRVETYMLSSRPAILQRLARRSMLEPHNRGLNLVHELVHVRQRMNVENGTIEEHIQPLPSLTRELEAYGLQVRAGTAKLGWLGMQAFYPNLMKIERARRFANGPNNDYEATERMLRITRLINLVVKDEG